MKYYKVKQIVTEYTTLSIVLEAGETAILYSQDGNMQYWGVDNTDENFLTKQHPECEVEEMAYDEIKPILDNSRLSKEFNKMEDDGTNSKYNKTPIEEQKKDTGIIE